MGEPGGAETRARGRRATDVVALVLLGALTLLLLADLVHLPERLPAVQRTGDDYVAVLAGVKLNRSVNYMVGAALDRTGGRVTRLVVPSDLGTSITRPSDTMVLASGQHPALEVGLLRTAVAAPVDKRHYDPVLSGGAIAAWRTAGRIVSYPKDVFVVRPAPADGVWVMCTDSGHTRIYLVPATDAPASAVAR